MGISVKVSFGQVAELVLPRNMGEELGIHDGESVQLTIDTDRAVLASPAFEEKLLVVRRIMQENRETLRRLAE